MSLFTAAFIGVRSDGKALFQHRDAGAHKFPSCWAQFGGRSEPGESPLECLKREVREELGLDLREAKALGRVRDLGNDCECFVFASPLDIPEETLRSQQAEGDDLGFFSWAQAQSLNAPPHCIEALRLAVEAGLVR